MNEAARQTLCELVATYGAGLSADARRCEGLLRDFGGQYRREIFVLTSAVREGVAAELLAGPGPLPLSAHVAQLRRRLEEHLALTPDAAAWAVESWAIALGVVPADGLPATGVTDPQAAGLEGEPKGSSGGVGAVVVMMVAVAALWALMGGSAATLVAGRFASAEQHANWVSTGVLAGAALGAFAGAVLRTVGGAVGDLVSWAIGGTVGGAALGALAGAAAGGVTAMAAGGPAMAGERALQWGTVGATAGALIATVLGTIAWRPLGTTPAPEAQAALE
jgi:hypothetical protein